MRLGIFLALFIATIATTAHAEPPLAPAFGNIPAVQQAQVSPDGLRVALLGGQGDRRTLTIATVDQPSVKVVGLGDVEALELYWVGNSQIAVHVALRSSEDTAQPYRFERNLVVGVDGQILSTLMAKNEDSRNLVEQKIVGITEEALPQVMIPGLRSAPGPGSIETHISSGRVSGLPRFTLYRVDPATGVEKIEEIGQADTRYWAVDRMGHARIRVDADDSSDHWRLFGRAKSNSKWVLYPDISVNDDRGLEYQGYSDPDDAIYLALRDESGFHIIRRRLESGQDERVGPSYTEPPRLVWDETRKAVAGVVSGPENAPVDWMDPGLGEVQPALAKVFKGREISLVSWSDRKDRFVLRVWSSTAPAEWYFYDKVKKQVSPLGGEYPELAKVKFGPTRFFRYKARDGLDIPAYVTFPSDAAAAEGKRPAIVLVHEGPASRDRSEFDWLTQFFASRGYVVLRPQYRGSDGFGRAFLDSGRGEWGDKIQTDLLDGVSSLTATGAIDATRVCIIGRTFGGYSALASAALHPQAYRCAASIAGFFNLSALVAQTAKMTDVDEIGLKNLRKELQSSNPTKMKDASPINRVADISVPVLLIGVNPSPKTLLDPSQQMAKAMKAASKPVDLLTINSNDYNLARSASRIQILQALDGFLAKNLPANAP